MLLISTNITWKYSETFIGMQNIDLISNYKTKCQLDMI